MSNSGKKVLVVGGITGAGINNPKTPNPFLCKGKYHEGCWKCNHSVDDASVFERGIPSQDILALLFERPHSLSSIEKMKKRMEECYVPDCGSALFLSETDARRVKEEFASSSGIEENACFIVKLSLVGCDDMAPEVTLRTILSGINRLSLLQNQIIELLVRKRGAKCAHYVSVDKACKECGCDIRGMSENKRKEQLIYRDGAVRPKYMEPQTEIPACLKLEI